MKTAWIVFLLCIASISGVLCAAAPPETAPATQPAVARLAVAAAAVPEAALKYALLPSVAEQTPGDAAPLYLQAFMMLTNISTDDYNINELLDAPRETFSVADAQGLVGKYSSVLALVDLAARRDRCHWSPAYREQGFAALLSYLNTSRNAARLLALRARVEIAQGHFDAALHSLQTGFAMVGHLKNDAALVQGLVGVGISNLFLDRLQEFVQAPGSPNLYWALAALPTPLADMRAMLQVERSWLEFEVPALKRYSASPMSPGQLASLMSRIHDLMVFGRKEPHGVEELIRQKLELAGILAISDGPARQWLQSHGHAGPLVKEMTSEQAVSAYFIESYELLSDDMHKWSALPYWQARGDGFQKSVAEFVKAKKEMSGNPLLDLVPALGHVHRQIALADRRIAMLQITEALRGYAAEHGGKLPASLADLAETPAPLDPMTGTSFEYEVSGKTAIVRSAAVAEHAREASGIWQITVTAGR